MLNPVGKPVQIQFYSGSTGHMLAPGYFVHQVAVAVKPAG